MALDFLGFFAFVVCKCFLGLLFPLTCELHRVAHPNSPPEALTPKMTALQGRPYKRVVRAEVVAGPRASGAAALTPSGRDTKAASPSVCS